MKALVLRHSYVEGTGTLGDFLRADGFQLCEIELDKGQAIPPLDAFDLMLVMGGPQNVWQDEAYPWLKNEKEAIRSFALEMERPYLGICLGHQLLASASGGHVGPSKFSEIGLSTVFKTDQGKEHEIFGALPDQFRCLQWHGAEVQNLPSSARVLATSDACRIQAFQLGQHAFGLQFHAEVSHNTISEWTMEQSYTSSLEAALGEGAVDKLCEDVSIAMPSLNEIANKLFNGLKRIWTCHERDP